MIKGVIKAKGVKSLGEELGFGDSGAIIEIGTDSSAAKSFVSRRGLGRIPEKFQGGFPPPLKTPRLRSVYNLLNIQTFIETNLGFCC